MSVLPPLLGHDLVRTSLARAADRGDLPGSLLLHGPPGIGKQRLGLWLAQRLLCASPAEPEPCGACPSCRLALRIEHPDLHWFFPLVRPKGVSGTDKLASALEDARAAELASKRTDPHHVRDPGEGRGIFVAQIQTLRRMAVARPAMGPRKVFLIGEAEALVPQESSPEAANALLKVLEEPPADTIFVLTAAEPDALLPTIRSRLLPVRMRRLPGPLVEEFLMARPSMDRSTAATIATIAEGSIGRALGLAPGPDGPGPLEVLRQQARSWLEATASSSPLPRLAAAHRIPPGGARGAFGDALAFLALWVRDLAATAAGADALVRNADARPLLAGLARHLPGAGRGAARAVHLVDEALAMGRTNVNPQLTLAWLLEGLRRAMLPA